MAKTKIPTDIQKKVNIIIDAFNAKEFIKQPDFMYYPIYRSDCLYIYRKEGEKDGPICRLKYTGDFTDWDFAIYKYSREKYDPEESCFPGFQHINGTIEGALKAGLEAYPPSWGPKGASIYSFLSNLFQR